METGHKKVIFKGEHEEKGREVASPKVRGQQQ
jgi:hypothetical protein